MVLRVHLITRSVHFGVTRDSRTFELCSPGNNPHHADLTERSANEVRRLLMLLLSFGFTFNARVFRPDTGVAGTRSAGERVGADVAHAAVRAISLGFLYCCFGMALILMADTCLRPAGGTRPCSCRAVHPASSVPATWAFYNGRMSVDVEITPLLP